MNASYRLLLFGMVPLGALAGGSLGGLFGLRPALVAGVVGLASPLVWLAFSPVYRLREMPEGPLEPTTGLTPNDLETTTGLTPNDLETTTTGLTPNDLETTTTRLTPNDKDGQIS
jgi:hypothetical protein